MPTITNKTPTESPKVLGKQFPEENTGNYKNAEKKVSKLSKIISEIKCFFKHEITPITFSAVTGAALIALSLACPPASVGAIACYVFAGATFSLPFATHKILHQEENQAVTNALKSRNNPSKIARN